MKKTIFLSLFLAFCFSASLCVAQEEGTAKGANNALSMDIYGANKKDAEKIWKNMVKQFDGKTKKGDNNEWYTKEISLPQIGPAGTVKMYMKIEEKDEMIRSIFLVTKDGEFVNSADYADEAEEVEKLFQSYIGELKEKTAEADVERQEDSLKKMSKDLSKLEKNNAKYHKEIEKCRKKIEEMENKIAQNEDEQATKKEEIEAQKLNVEKVIAKFQEIQKANQ